MPVVDLIDLWQTLMPGFLANHARMLSGHFESSAILDVLFDPKHVVCVQWNLKMDGCCRMSREDAAEKEAEAFLQLLLASGSLLLHWGAGSYQIYDAGAAALHFVVVDPKLLHWVQSGLRHLSFGTSGGVNHVHAADVAVDTPRLSSHSIRLLAPHLNLQGQYPREDLH